MKLCTFSECGRRAHGRGLCDGHLYQLRHGGALRPIVKPIPHGEVCSFDGCGKPYAAHGLCAAHCKQRLAGKELTPVRLSMPGASLDERFWARVDKNGPVPDHVPDLGPCWLWTGATSDQGYGIISPPQSSRRRAHSMVASRVSWELANGALPAGMKVCHRCDNPPCVRPDHLFTGTHVDNMQDCVTKGRFPARDGETNGRARLSEDDVRTVRERISAGGSNSEIAVSFGVNRATINAIRTGRNWSDIA